MTVKSIARAKVYGEQRRARRFERESTLASDPSQLVRRLRREWLQRFAWRLALFVATPTTVAALYYGLVASNQYESTAVLMIQDAGPGEESQPEHLLRAPSSSTASTRQLLAMREYMLSRTLLQRLDADIGLLKHFENSTWDYFARLRARPSLEQAYSYIGKRIAADYDTSSGTISLRVRAFEPGMAQSFARAIIQDATAKLDELTEQTRSAGLKDAELQLQTAKARLISAKQAVTRARGTADSQGHPATAGTASEIASPIHDDSQGAPAEGDASERSSLELAFAQREYDASIAVLADLRAREIRRRPVLLTLVKPSLPDSSSYPRRVMSVLSVFIFSFLALGIGSLTVSAVREHGHH